MKNGKYLAIAVCLSLLLYERCILAQLFPFGTLKGKVSYYTVCISLTRFLRFQRGNLTLDKYKLLISDIRLFPKFYSF